MTFTDPVLIKVIVPLESGHTVVGYNLVERRIAEILTRSVFPHRIVEIDPVLITEMKQMGMVQK